MPGRLKVRIVAGRQLPVMDRASELTDAFVEIKFGTTTYKTEVYPKSLNPLWNSPWFKFEVDDEHLQDELLQVRILDHDTYSSHDAIGKVNIDIDPLLDPESRNDLYGWFPIYDTMHGIRGEILLKVKLELFADSNQFRQSSCGFKFICATRVPDCYKITAIHGFVHELLVREDPEYKWIEKLRTPRASNEARQRLFSKMSGELQRHIGTKVESIGGNAVVGFHHSFDIEGDSGIVVRGIGTAVTLESIHTPKRHSKTSPKLLETHETAFQLPNEEISFQDASSLLHHSMQEENFSHIRNQFLHRTSVQGLSAGVLKDFPFYTLRSYPPNFVTRISTMVTSHSVKLLEKVYSTAESDTREGWWDELRQEIKSNCHALGCNSVIGYSEKTTICDEVVVLSAQGSAAVVDTSLLSCSPQLNVGSRRSSRDALAPPYGSGTLKSESRRDTDADLFRVPFRIGEHTHAMNFQPSPLNPDVCVPDILLSALDVPDGVRTVGKAAFIQARYCRSKKKGQGESNAVNVSEILPFIEYELHKQLCKKLKLRCMNAVFGFESNITLGENLVVGVATGTAVFLEALPSPSTLSDDADKPTGSGHSNVEQQCAEYASRCKRTYDISPKIHISGAADETSGHQSPSTSIASLDSSLDGRKSLAIAVEDTDDEAELLTYLSDDLPPPGCFLSTLDRCPGVEECHHLLQSFSLVRRVRYRDDADDTALNTGLWRSCEEALSGVWFRLRMKAEICHICSLKFHVVLPDDDELQIWMTGAAITREPNEPRFESRKVSRQSSLCSSAPNSSSRQRLSSSYDSEEQTFHSRSLRSNELRPFDSPLLRLARSASRKFLRSSSVGGRFRHESGSGRVRHSSEGAAPWNLPEALTEDIAASPEPVHVVPMACVPGHRVVKHAGILNMFIIRETTSVRGSDEEVTIAEPPNGTGSCWFVTRALAETNALIRAHVVAVGGNALTSRRFSYRTLTESLTKNEAQTLLHVTGDVVIVRGL